MVEFDRKYWAFIPESLIGRDAIHDLGGLLQERGLKKPLLVTGSTVVKTEAFAKAVESLRNSMIEHAIFSKCKADSPTEVVEECARTAKSEGCDSLIGIGGGSSMDTTKLASVLVTNTQDIHELIGRDKVQKPGLFKVLIPTTAGTGSEWSHPAVLTDDRDGYKKPVFSRFTASDLTIIDPTLTLDLPPRVTADTGVDALAHCIESYSSWKSNLLSDMFAEKGIELVFKSLRLAYAKGRKHLEARYDMCLAAALGMATHTCSAAGIAHSMNYPLTAKTHVSHGTALAILLPHVMEFNLLACAQKYARLARLIGEEVSGCSTMEAARKVIGAVRDLRRDLQMPLRTTEIGFTEEDIPDALDFLFENQLYGMENNPRDPSREDFIQIYKAAL
jgi:alcohol dehydrogenase class IV